MNSAISYMRNRPYREAQLPTEFDQKAFGQLKTILLQTTSSPPFVLRDSRASEARARVKITPREKRRHAAGREQEILGMLLNTSIFTIPIELNHTYQHRGMASTLRMRPTTSARQWQPRTTTFFGEEEPENELTTWLTCVTILLLFAFNLYQCH